MISLTTEQQRIIDETFLIVDWLFVVEDNPVPGFSSSSSSESSESSSSSSYSSSESSSSSSESSFSSSSSESSSSSSESSASSESSSASSESSSSSSESSSSATYITTYYWSTKGKYVDGQLYDYKVINFDGITLNRRNSGAGMQSPGELNFTISNKNNVLIADDFIGGTVTLTLRVTDREGSADLNTWKFDIRKAEGMYQTIQFTCEDFLQKYLRGTYPNTKYVENIFSSSENREEHNVHVPVPIGDAYIPLRPVYIIADVVNYYLLGPADKTYVIDRVKTPTRLGHTSTFTSANYTFTQYTRTDSEGNSWKMFSPIIADDNKDGVADSAGFWKDGSVLLDMPTKFTRSDTKDFGGSMGTHTGAEHGTTFTNSNLSGNSLFTANALVGYYAVNFTDGSYGKIIANTSNTVTVNRLTGGTDNKWQTSDVYYVCGCASVIKYILLDMGVPASRIDDNSFAEAEATYAAWSLLWNGAFWYTMEREEVLAFLLNQCHSTISVRDKVYLRVLTKTPQMSLGKSHIMKDSDVGPGSFSYRMTLNDNQLSDAGYVVWTGGATNPQDELKRFSIPAKWNVKTNYSSEELLVPFIESGSDAPKIGIMWLQRILLAAGSVRFSAKPKCLALEPDDMVAVSHADYGGSHYALIESISIARDLKMDITGITFSDDLDDWDDLSSVSTLSEAAEAEADTIWRPVISGPDSGQTGNEIPNLVRGRLRIGSGTRHVLIDPDDGSDCYMAGGNMSDLDTTNWRIDGGFIIGVDDSASLAKFFVGDYSSNEWFQWDGTNVTISCSGTDALVIKSGGNIRVEAGGDLILEPDPGAGDPSYLRFEGSSTDILFYSSTATGDTYAIKPSDDYICNLSIGGATSRYKTIDIYGADTSKFRAYASAGLASQWTMACDGVSTSYGLLEVYGSGTNYIECTYHADSTSNYIQLYSTASAVLWTKFYIDTVYKRMELTAKNDGLVVGINKTSPVNPLHVYGLGYDDVIYLESSDANAYIAFKDNSTATTPQVGAVGDDLVLRVASATSLTVDATNNWVVVGASVAEAPLHVYHATENDILKLESGDVACYIEFWDSTTSDGPQIGCYGDKLYIRTSSITNVVVDADGELGIGLVSPLDYIHIKDDDTDATPSIRLENDSQIWRIRCDGGHASGDPLIIRDNTGFVDVVVIEDGCSANTLYLEGTGVGIGTAPDEITRGLQILAAASDDGVLVENDGAYRCAFIGDSNRTGAAECISRIAGKWNGSLVAHIDLATGSDTTNKDDGTIEFHTYSASASSQVVMLLMNDGGVQMPNLKSGTDQGDAGAAANELYHDTDDNTIKIGV